MPPSKQDTPPVRRRDTPPAAKPPAAVVASETLLGGRDQIRILHRGELYSLRQTRNGKLILMK
ncbi:MAG: hemin uptake protein HemP [Pseudomonadota bacterium]